MIASVEEGKNLMLQAHAAQIKAEHPRWTRARCWTLATEQHPELAEEFAGEATSASQPAFRYTEKVRYTEVSKPLMEMLDLPIRIEA